MPDNTYRVGIGAEDKEFQAVMSRMEGGITRLVNGIEQRMSRAESAFSRMERGTRSALNVFGAYVSYRAIEGVGRAALEQERALGALSGAYQATGVYSDELMRQSIALAGEMQRLVNQADDVTESNIALMQNIGKLSADQIPGATRAAIGLATAYKMDVQTAFQLVGRAAAGQTQMLSRYGIVLGEGSSQQEKFNRLLEMGATGFEQARRNAADAMGGYERLGVYLGDLKEAIGGFATTPLVIGGIETLTQNIMEVTNYVGNLGLTVDLVAIKFQRMYVRASGALSQAQLASGQIPGARNAGLTPGGIQASVEQQLAQLDKVALGLVNEFEREQNERLRRLGENRVPGPSTGSGTDDAPGAGSGRGSRVSTRWEESEFRRLAREEDRLNESQRRNEEAERKADIDWFNQQVEMTEALQKAEYEYLDGVREKHEKAVAEMERRQEAWSGYWGDLVYGMYESADGSFRNIGQAFDRMLKQMAVRAAVYGSINLLTGGTFGAGVKMGLGLPGRAGGGPVDSGRPYWVGERGPELFVPKQAGAVIPQSQVSAGNFALHLHITSEEKRAMSVESDVALGNRLLRVIRDDHRIRKEISERK